MGYRQRFLWPKQAAMKMSYVTDALYNEKYHCSQYFYFKLKRTLNSRNKFSPAVSEGSPDKFMSFGIDGP